MRARACRRTWCRGSASAASAGRRAGPAWAWRWPGRWPRPTAGRWCWSARSPPCSPCSCAAPGRRPGRSPPSAARRAGQRPRRLRPVREPNGYRPAPVAGMVGAGQLARMTAQAAVSLGIGFRVLAGAADESAAQVCADVRVGDYRSAGDLLAFARDCEVVTFDHEHVPQAGLAELERAGVALRPSPGALRYAQDKLAMRDRLTRLGVPCPRYAPVRSAEEVIRFADVTAGWPVVLKAVAGGYDGRGVWACATPQDAAGVLGRAGASGVALLAEEHVAFERELAVQVARSPNDQAAAYPVVETVQRDGICVQVLAPAPGLPEDRAIEAQRLGLRIARALDVTGLLAVELFETSGGLLVNELAMRPHNSGHWTIEGARTSQFEQHLRAVLDLPLGSPHL